MNGSKRRMPNGAWWFYFALVAVLATLSLFGARSPLDFAAGVINAIGLIGVWGYLRQVAVGYRVLWVGYFALSVVASLLALGLNAADSVPAGALLLALVFVLPLYYALWQYAFRSPGVWQASDA